MASRATSKYRKMFDQSQKKEAGAYVPAASSNQNKTGTSGSASAATQKYARLFNESQASGTVPASTDVLKPAMELLKQRVGVRLKQQNGASEKARNGVPSPMAVNVAQQNMDRNIANRVAHGQINVSDMTPEQRAIALRRYSETHPATSGISETTWNGTGWRTKDWQDPSAARAESYAARAVDAENTLRQMAEEKASKERSNRRRIGVEASNSAPMSGNRTSRAAQQLERAQEHGREMEARTALLAADTYAKDAERDARLTQEAAGMASDPDRQRYIEAGSDPRIRTTLGHLTDQNFGDYTLVYDRLSDEQKQTFAYLAGKNGMADGIAYLDLVSRPIIEQYGEEETAKSREFANKYPVLGAGASIAQTGIGGIQTAAKATADMIEKMRTGREPDINDTWYLASRMGKASREGTTERSEEDARAFATNNIDAIQNTLHAVGVDKTDEEVINGYSNIAGFLTGTGIDMANSLIAGYTGTAVFMGVSAGSDAYLEALESGAPIEDALMNGVLQGVFEGLFERFTIGNLQALQEVDNVATWRQLFKNVAKSSFTNASEEFLTELADYAADALTMGDLSKFQQGLVKYRAEAIRNGLAGEEADRYALQRVLGDMGTQALMAGLGGALSGAGSSMFTGVTTKASNARYGADITQENLLDLADINTGDQAYTIEGQQFTDEQEQAKNTQEQLLDMAARMEEGKKVSSSERGALAKEAEEVRKTSERIQKEQQFYENIRELTRKGTEEGFGDQGKAVIREIGLENRPDAYASFAAYYNNGRHNITLTDAVKAKAQEVLTAEEMTAAFNAGARDANALFPQQTVSRLKKAADGVKIAPTAGTVDKSRINYNGLTSQQKLRVDVYGNLLTKAFGFDVRFIQSDLVNGKYEGINGSFSRVNGRPTITLDVNAGMMQEGDWTGDITDMKKMLPTIAHEMTHWFENSSPTEYRELANAVVDALVKSGQYNAGLSFNQVLAAEQLRLDREVKRATGNDVKHTQADALHEIVARSCEELLNGNEQVMEMFQSLDAETKKSLLDHVNEIFGKIREFFRQMLSGYESSSPEARALHGNIEALNQLQEKWNRALAVAKDNAHNDLQAVGVDENDSDVRNSDRSYDYNSVGYDWAYMRGIINGRVQKQAEGLLINHPKALRTTYDGAYYIVTTSFQKDGPYDTVLLCSRTSELNINAVIKITGADSQEINYKESVLYGYLQKLPIEGVFRKGFDGEGLQLFNVADDMGLYMEAKRARRERRQSGAASQVTESIENGARVRRENGKIVGLTHPSVLDSNGQRLSEGQEDYFSRSVNRDQYGRLKIMYPWDSGWRMVSPDDYKSKSNGTFGMAYYFTDRDRFVAEYGEKNGVFLNIVNPVQAGMKIKAKQLKRFIHELATNANYGLEGYGSDATEQSVYESLKDKDDFGKLFDLSETVVGDFVSAIELFNRVNGTSFDGIRTDPEVAVFNLEQIKSIDNLNPTNKPDVQFSLRDSSGVELSPGQQEYFKDSKVRDGDGNLLRVYHGTSEDFNVFDRTKGRSTMDIQGSFFSPWDIDAEGYGPNVKTVYLNIKNPAPEGVAYKALNMFKGQNDAGIKAREYLISKGYDGVNNSGEEYIAFYPNQIKNVDNLNPTSDEDIRYSTRTIIGPSGNNYGDGVYLDSSLLTALNEDERLEMTRLFVTTELVGQSFVAKDSNGNSILISIANKSDRIKTGKAKRRVIDELRVNDSNPIKQESLVLADELIQMSKSNGSKKPTKSHDWLDNYGQNNWDYRKVVLQEQNGNVWEARLVIANPNDGRKILYDIDRIKMVEGSVKASVPTATNKNVSQPAQNSNPQSAPVGTSTSNGSNQDRNIDLDSAIEALVEKYGALPRGENAVKEIDVPMQTSDKMRTSRFVRTVLESGVTTDEMDDRIKEEILKEAMSYVPISDKRSEEYADKTIEKSGMEEAQKIWDQAHHGVDITKDDMVLGEKLLMKYAEAGNTEMVVRMTQELAAEGTRMGQNIQAMRMLKKMAAKNPAIGLGYIQKTVDQMNRDNEKEFGKKAKRMEIDPDLATEYLNAKTQDEIDAALGKIYKDLAEQAPKKKLKAWVDKLRTWRYMAMLGNPRTHVRNIVGNAIFVPAVAMKNVIGTVAERASGAKTRTKAIVLDRSAVQFAKNDFMEMQDVLQGNQKKGIKQEILEKQKVYKSRVLNAISDFNSAALEAEDLIFLRFHYVNAMAQYMTANKLTADGITPQQLAKARKYAVQEAQKATYRDANAVSTWLNQSGKLNAALKYTVEGIVPFKKTPLNIFRRGIEYSPAMVLERVTKGVYDLNQGKISVNEWIDGLASGLTGSAIMAIGMFLASTGAVMGGFPEDEKDLKKLQGLQEYAVKIGNHTYTIDWAVPAAMPFFVGVEVMSALMAERKATFADYADAVTQMLDPMLNLSMLSGLNNTLAAVSNSDSKLQAFMTENFFGFLGQYVPTLLGQIARTIDTTQRINYQDKNTGMPSELLYFVEKMQNKIPYLTFSNDPYLNQWGEENVTGPRWAAALENFISPGYVSTLREDEVMKELERLQGAQEEDVVPKKLKKYVGQGDERMDLTSAQYTQWQRVAGQMSYNILDQMIHDKRYDQLDSDQQAAAIKMAYDYAKAVGRLEFQPGYEIKGDTKKIYDAYQENKTPAHDTIFALSMAKEAKSNAVGEYNENGDLISGTKKADSIDNIIAMKGTQEEKGMAYELAYPSDALDAWKKTGGSSYDFMMGSKLATEIPSEETSGKSRYAYVVESNYTPQQKVAWLHTQTSILNSDKYQTWKSTGGSDWDYIKYRSDLSKYNGMETDKKRTNVVEYIKNQTTNEAKRKALWVMAGYKLDSKKDGKVIKDGNYNKYMK